MGNLHFVDIEVERQQLGAASGVNSWQWPRMLPIMKDSYTVHYVNNNDRIVHYVYT